MQSRDHWIQQLKLFNLVHHALLFNLPGFPLSVLYSVSLCITLKPERKDNSKNYEKLGTRKTT